MCVCDVEIVIEGNRWVRDVLQLPKIFTSTKSKTCALRLKHSRRVVKQLWNYPIVVTSTHNSFRSTEISRHIFGNVQIIRCSFRDDAGVSFRILRTWWEKSSFPRFLSSVMTPCRDTFETSQLSNVSIYHYVQPHRDLPPWPCFSTSGKRMQHQPSK